MAKSTKLCFLALVLVFGFLCGVCLYAQEETAQVSEAREDLDLRGVLELFRVAENLEAFEKTLNLEANEVNNLDLDGNEEVDYIRLEEHVEGNAHIVVLQVPLGENDYQDVATIEIERLAENDYTLQIIGNEELYGENYIIEPVTDSQSVLVQNGTAGIKVPDGFLHLRHLGVSQGLFIEHGLEDSSVRSHNSAVVIVIGALPCVRIMFRPGYRPWISPWRWHRWPGWWRPWKPLAPSIHRIRVKRFHQRHWRRVAIRRSARSHKVYRKIRKSTPKAVKIKPLSKKVKPTKKKVPKKKKTVKKKKPAKKKKK